MKRQKYKLNKEIFEKRSNKIHKGKYSYVESDYINQRTKVKIICPIHGEFLQTPKNHMKGQGCPECGKKYASEWRKSNYNSFILESKKRFSDTYSFPNIKNEYENSHSTITIECKICGNKFSKIACDHLTSNHGGCSHYEKTTSKLENEIEKMLHNMEIDFIKQKKFKNFGALEIDFYLPKYNIAIECQGIQHFLPVDWFGGEKEFKKTIERDLRKRKLCEKNGIKLLYYSNLGIEYPYLVFENKEKLLKEIIK